ncbi:MAG: NAD-dependent deacylase [Bacteroidales bacterium]|nr:NAD-dependent deacylase [Bacteroidales bacterium]
MKKLVVLTGAGISAESGIATFRDSNGLWENHRVEDVASPRGWELNPSLVLDFYNQRRRQVHEVEPNNAHIVLANLESEYDVEIITQNIDDLHERAGSTKVMHLHGEIKKARSTGNESYVVDIEGTELNLGDKCPFGHQLRPHIVWFGEAVPMMENAVRLVKTADIFLVVGTGLQVYPAASLIDYVPDNCVRYLIDPKEVFIPAYYKFNFIQEKAGAGMDVFVKSLKEEK